ncbi:hypothetical protein [Antarctic microvirus COCH21_V_SP_16]|nr:hypothetical protein [Antarctic microvirus COCH21_V_SP_16]
MSQFKNSTNARQWEKTPEENNSPSLTIPDQTMSINEIVRRFASGLPLGGNRVPEYDGEDDVLDGINPKTLDMSELHEIRMEFANELKALAAKPQQQTKKQLSIEDVESIIKKHNTTQQTNTNTEPPFQ